MASPLSDQQIKQTEETHKEDERWPSSMLVNLRHDTSFDLVRNAVESSLNVYRRDPTYVAQLNGFGFYRLRGKHNTGGIILATLLRRFIKRYS